MRHLIYQCPSCGKPQEGKGLCKVCKRGMQTVGKGKTLEEWEVLVDMNEERNQKVITKEEIS